MKNLILLVFITSLLIMSCPGKAQLIKRPPVTTNSTIVDKPDLRIPDSTVTPEFKVTVKTWNAGKISASQAVISYSIRIDDTTQPMEHGVCYSTVSNPSLANPKTIAKGYTINTLYGELSGLKPDMKYYVKAYMKLLNYPDKIYYGNEISFTTLAATTK